MGNKFLITLCLAVLLQDSMGSLANRSYNPRFRNVNKKYLKAESENGFEDREITQELLSNADVILVSLPEENSANELPAYQKENRNHLSNSIQHKPKKPNHSSLSQADSPVIQQNKPLVLQLLGWTGNPPPPIAVPSKESEIDTENIAVPIVIKEEWKPESSLIESAQENKEEWSQKPEAESVVVVEEKIMNEEPSIVIEEELKPEVSMMGLAQENKQDWSQKPEAMPVEVVEEQIVNEEPIIVIKEELKPEASMIGSAQENKQEWSQKPEAMPVVVVEEKITNDEPSFVIKEELKPEASMVESAQENKQEWNKKPEAMQVVVVEEQIMNEEPTFVIKEELKPEASMIGLAQENKQEWNQKPEAIPVVVVEEQIMNEEPSIVIKEELKPEALMIESAQENKQEWIQKPEAIPVVVVEEKIMNEEPVLIADISEDKKETSASENWAKPTEIKNDKEASVMLETISESAPLIIEPISKPVPEVIEIEDKKESSKTKPQNIEDAIIADMKLNLFGAGMKKKESASNAAQEPTVVFDLLPENLLVMSDASISEMIDGENKKEVSEPAIEIISEKIVSQDMQIPSSDDKILAEKPAKEEHNKKVIESVAAISEIMSEANKDSMPLGEEIKIAMDPALPESIIVVDSVPEMALPMAANKDKMESKPEEIVMQAPMEVVVVENSAAENSFPMAQDNNKMVSKPVEIVMQESPVAEISFPKVEEIPMAVQEPIVVAIKESSVAESSFPMNAGKDKIVSKPEEITMQLPHKVVMKENSAPQSSSPIFQKQSVESKLDSKIPDEKLKPSQKFPSAEQEAQLLTAAKPALSENPEKVIVAENSLINNTRTRPSKKPRPSRPGKKPSKKPAKPTVAATTTVAPTTLGVSVGLDI